MSKTSANLKITIPYAQALFDFACKESILHGITADFNNLYSLLCKTPELAKYLKNPLVKSEMKIELLSTIFKGRVNEETLIFFNILINRNRIDLLFPILHSYLELVYRTANVKKYEIQTAFPMTKFQKWKLINRLKALTETREIRLNITVDETLIGGFLIKTPSKVVDFTVKNRLEKIAKYLDTVLEI